MAKDDQARLSLTPGTRFGRYEVITEIASGGMATVFLARALGAAGFQRLVAIKLMHPHYAKDEDFVAMFLDEARLAARIRHPNVVATLDLENDDEGLYLVMEYIEGDGLLGLLRAAARSGKRIPPPVAIRIVLDMLAGLHAAHELTDDRGEPLRLVHRDVSPHNVLVGIDGISRITDFGIARAEERLGATRDGQIKGKLAYMAPEQTTANPVDRRADLFATGVVLWECLAGRRLLAGQNDGEVLRNLLVNPIPRLKEALPEIPDAIDAVCARALEREADKRFGSAAQFADALEEAAGAVGIGSARAVAQFVREMSGGRIEAMQQRVRGLLPADSTGSQPTVSAVRRRRENTDPERTVRRDGPPLPGSADGAGAASEGGENADGASSPSRRIPPVVVTPQGAPGGVVVGVAEEEPRRKRSPVLFAAIGVAALLMGVGGFAVARSSVAPRAPAQPQPVRAAIAQPPPQVQQPQQVQQQQVQQPPQQQQQALVPTEPQGAAAGANEPPGAGGEAAAQQGGEAANNANVAAAGEPASATGNRRRGGQRQRGGGGAGGAAAGAHSNGAGSGGNAGGRQTTGGQQSGRQVHNPESI